MSSRLRVAAAIVAALLILRPGSGAAHDDHNDTPSSIQNVAPRAEASSANYELVAIANGAELTIYLDWLNTNVPVDDATIEVETPNGPAKAEPQSGVYRLAAPWLAGKDKVGLVFSVTAGGTTDILAASLVLHAHESRSFVQRAVDSLKAIFQSGLLITSVAGFLLGAGLVTARNKWFHRASLAVVCLAPLTWFGESSAQTGNSATSSLGLSERAQRFPDGNVFVPKPVQRIFDVRTTFTEMASHRRVVELPGRIIPDPDASGFVQAAVGGRLSPPEKGFPRLGTIVKKGDVLAYVTPPLQAIDVSDMRQRQGELDQQIQIVSQRLARYEVLAPSGSVARSVLDETRLELQGLKDRRAALDNSRREPEPLIAPVFGVIADGTPIAGQMAQSNAVIFHIVDPDKLWIEALSFEPLTGVQTASAVTASGKRLALQYRGAGFAGRSQSIPVHFAVEGDTRDLRPGQLVNVLVGTLDEKRGIAVPRTSVVRSANGQDFVYLHISAERFSPRAVRIEPLDGERVLVLSGVEVGQRIVTQGAELLDHVR